MRRSSLVPSLSYQGRLPRPVKTPPVGPSLPIRAYLSSDSSTASSVLRWPMKPLISVGVSPGLTALTRMPSARSFLARRALRPFWATFEDWYANQLGSGVLVFGVTDQAQRTHVRRDVDDARRRRLA
jgi:hypothetical protein